MAVLVAPAATALVYEDPAMNDGTDWRSVVGRFFRSSGEAVAAKAEEIINDHALCSNVPSLVVVEVLPYKATEAALRTAAGQTSNGGVGTIEVDEAGE